MRGRKPREQELEEECRRVRRMLAEQADRERLQNEVIAELRSRLRMVRNVAGDASLSERELRSLLGTIGGRILPLRLVNSTPPAR
jgi:hypothetical protein